MHTVIFSTGTYMVLYSEKFVLNLGNSYPVLFHSSVNFNSLGSKVCDNCYRLKIALESLKMLLKFQV